MTTTTTIPGVTAGTRPCWVIINRATGEPYAAEETPHFDNIEEAKDSLEGAWETRPNAEPRQLDAPCLTAVSECGEVFDADGMHLHFETTEQAQRSLDASGWTVVGGRLCCEECGEHCGSL